MYDEITNRFTPTQNTTLRLFVINNYYHSFKQYIKNNATCQPEAYQNSALCMACEIGDVRFVKRLLKHPDVNPADDKNWPLRIACYKGHIDVVKLLLLNSRIISIGKFDYVKNAYNHKHYDVCKLLLQDDRIINNLSENVVNIYLNNLHNK